ncbi:MAG: hypothetical protein M3Q31_22935 [Actinomycetota bacterium]|nr:hypothetical protein [Actinomycetota bacterium]
MRRRRVLAFGRRYQQIAAPFQRKFSRHDLHKLLANYGPVADMIGRPARASTQRRSRRRALLTSRQFYQTDYTKPLLFLADGTYMANLAQQERLLGTQWGMMNETGRYPGQTWLWLYTTWYQVPPFNTSPNADVQIWALMMLLTILLALLPFIPGLG